MKNCEHKSKQECAWANAKKHPDYHENDIRACYQCGGIIKKGDYLGQQLNTKYSWNIEHIDSNPNNNDCENLSASHPKCNQKAG